MCVCVSLLQGYYSAHVCTVYITPHTPNNFNLGYFYDNLYFILLFNIEFSPEICGF
jgi:hypothetical protein